MKKKKKTRVKTPSVGVFGRAIVFSGFTNKL